jgi:DNA-binding GntR family transcriptional regulator
MIKETTLKEKLFHVILNDIMDGVLLPDDFISEKQIMERYENGKSTAREAVIDLCRINVLESLPRKGYRIVPLSVKEMIQIIDLRSVFEQWALKIAYPNITSDLLDTLSRHEDECEEEIKQSGKKYKYSQYWENNMYFHLSLCRQGENRYFNHVLEELICHCSRFVPQYYSGSWRRNREITNGEYHLQIIDALKRHDLETAQKKMEQDIFQMKDVLIADIINNGNSFKGGNA